MFHIEKLTLPRLLGVVERHLRRLLPGRISVPTRAYAAARSGIVSVIECPAVVQGRDRDATAAILAVEMAQRQTRMFVLVQPQDDDTIHLVGHRLGQHPTREDRLLAVIRSGQKISGLDRVDTSPRHAGGRLDTPSLALH